MLEISSCPPLVMNRTRCHTQTATWEKAGYGGVAEALSPGSYRACLNTAPTEESDLYGA